MRNMIISILGLQGSGKDTQGINLAQKLNLMLFVTSKYIRKEIEEGLANDPFDCVLLEEDTRFKAGYYNRFGWVLELVKKNIKYLADNNFSGHSGIVFTGSPRTLVEAEGLIPFLEELVGAENIRAIHLDVPEEVCIERILARSARKPDTNRPFDMSRELIKNKRMPEYYQFTVPMLEYFRKRNMLVNIDGNQDPDQVLAAILKALEKLE